MKLLNLGIVSCLLLLGACVKNVNGTFEAKSELRLRGKNGLVTLREGAYSSTLKLKKSKKVTLVVQAGGKEKIEFSVPSGVSIPRDYGTMRLTSQEIGQPYDLEAVVDNRFDSSTPVHTTESCRRSVIRDVCRYETRPSHEVCHTDHHGRRICRRVTPPAVRVCSPTTTYVYGIRDVTYRYNGKTTEFSFKLFDQNSQAEVGTFKGHEYSSNREVLSYGHCRIGPVVIYP